MEKTLTIIKNDEKERRPVAPEEVGNEWEDTPVMVTRGAREGKKNLAEFC